SLYVPGRPSPALPSFPTRRSSDLACVRTFIHKVHGSSHHFHPSFKGRFMNFQPVEACPAESRDEGWMDVDDPVPVSCDHLSRDRSEEHTSELQSRFDLVYRLLLAK